MTETNAEISTPNAESPAPVPEAGGPPWIEQLIRGKAAMADRLALGDALPLRVPEFWAEASWPLHTIEADESLAPLAGDFLARMAKQGLSQALNVIIRRKSEHNVGAIFGPHAYNMCFNYGLVEALVEKRKELVKEGKEVPLPPKDEEEDFKSLPKAQKALKGAAYGVGVDLDEKGKTRPELTQAQRQFAFLRHLDNQKYPAPTAAVEPEQWRAAGAEAKALCEKFGLRAVNVPLAFDAAQARSFVARLDHALGQISDFVGAEPAVLGLGQWLGLRARAPGERSEQEAAATEDAAALAEIEKEKTKKQKADSEHGMFMGNFIQIEVSPNFEPVVLAHEWIHSLDLWAGSRDIVAREPWRGWQSFASQIAFYTKAEQYPALMRWREELLEGGVEGREKKPDFLEAIPVHPFLSQMRYDKERDPEGEFHLSMGELLGARLMRAFEKIELDPEREATTRKQSVALGSALAEAAREHGMDHRDSARAPDSLARARKSFYEEWGDLAGDWARRQAGERSEAELADVEALARTQALSALASGWSWSLLERFFPNPDVHTLQALRMDNLSGNMRPYFATPHEMLAYKMEMLFLAREQQPAADDKVAPILLAWLRDEIVPQLREAREVTLDSVMGKKIKAKAPTP